MPGRVCDSGMTRQDLICKRFRKRVTGLEPATFSLGSYQKSPLTTPATPILSTPPALAPAVARTRPRRPTLSIPTGAGCHRRCEPGSSRWCGRRCERATGRSPRTRGGVLLPLLTAWAKSFSDWMPVECPRCGCRSSLDLESGTRLTDRASMRHLPFVNSWRSEECAHLPTRRSMLRQPRS